MSHRFEGRNLEEALNVATQTLGVDRWQLTHHVLLEKRGFLGGMKRVVIEVDVNENAAPPATPVAAAPTPIAVDESEPMVPASAPAPRSPRPQRTPGGGRGGPGRSRGRDSFGDSGASPSRDGRRGGRGRGRRREEESDGLQPGDFEKFMVDAPEQGEESDGARLVREWCERVIGLARLELAVRTEENETQIIVRMYGRDVRRLVEQHGELLDAIQVLANKALVGRKVEKEIELDADEFKGNRMDDLGRRAREAADRVRQGGDEELLPAMTPIERRIVHLALESDAEVTTVSRGEGFYKRVAIVRRGAEASES